MSYLFRGVDQYLNHVHFIHVFGRFWLLAGMQGFGCNCSLKRNEQATASAATPSFLLYHMPENIPNAPLSPSLGPSLQLISAGSEDFVLLKISKSTSILSCFFAHHHDPADQDERLFFPRIEAQHRLPRKRSRACCTTPSTVQDHVYISWC